MVNNYLDNRRESRPELNFWLVMHKSAMKNK